MEQTLNQNETVGAWLSRQMSEDTKRGMRLKAMNGGTNGLAPLGYVNRRRGDETWIEIDPAVAPLVREAFELLEGGMAIRPALAEMTAKGLRTRSGKPPCVASFHQMATNPSYAGLVRYEGRLHPGKHEALITLERFWKIQGRLVQRRKRPKECGADNLSLISGHHEE